MSTRIRRIGVRRTGALIAALAVAVGIATAIEAQPAAEAGPTQAGTRICERYGWEIRLENGPRGVTARVGFA